MFLFLLPVSLIAILGGNCTLTTAYTCSSIVFFRERASSLTVLRQHTTTDATTSVILYHKPIDVVTTHATDDVLGRLNVYEDISQRYYSTGTKTATPLPPNFPVAWHSIGRLDAATSGLLLLTNDGGLVHHVTNHRAASIVGSSPLQKTYEVLAMGYHTHDCTMFDQFRQGGIDLGNNQLTLPVQDLQVLDHPTCTTTRLSLSIIEGRNRQIRRMFHSCGSGVMRLTRTAIGSSLSNSLTIDLVPNIGDCYILSNEMVASTLGWKTRPVEKATPSANKLPTRSPRRRPKSRG